MKREILIYGSIYSYAATAFITEMEEHKDKEITVRINTPGGDALATYGMIAKFNEHPKEKTIQVDGHASSMGAFLCCYAETVTCLDVSEFVFHRVAYPEYIESNSNYFTDAMREGLIKTNKDLRAAMESKFTAEKWEQVTGVSLDDMFSLDSRIDVLVDAKKALKLGLVNKINPITPSKKAEIESLQIQMAAQSFKQLKVAESNPEVTKIKTANKMTIEQLKNEHPSVFQEAKKEGKMEERDRVGAYMAYVDVDPKAVKEGIEKGDNLSQTQMAELSRKAFAKSAIDAVVEDNPAEIKTGEADASKTANTAKNEEWMKEVKSHIK